MKCIKPIYVKIKDMSIPVPCGHCAWCLKRKRDDWFFRLKIEKKDHKVTKFVTLTYNDDHIPYHIDDDGVVHFDVSKSDVQDFVKKIRNSGHKVRYMINSEYGRLGRPHYHGILFGDDPNTNYCDYWSKGFSSSLPAKDGSLKYVVKYLLKGSNVPDGSVSNFSLMSRRPGLGHSFVYKGEPYILDRGGVKLVPGRYYKRQYRDSLDAKFRSYLSDLTLEYLSQSDPLKYLRILHEANAPQMDFEVWLSDLYIKDYKQQLKINKKN